MCRNEFSRTRAHSVSAYLQTCIDRSPPVARPWFSAHHADPAAVRHAHQWLQPAHVVAPTSRHPFCHLHPGGGILGAAKVQSAEERNDQWHVFAESGKNVRPAPEGRFDDTTGSRHFIRERAVNTSRMQIEMHGTIICGGMSAQFRLYQGICAPGRPVLPLADQQRCIATPHTMHKSRMGPICAE